MSILLIFTAWYKGAPSQIVNNQSYWKPKPNFHSRDACQVLHVTYVKGSSLALWHFLLFILLRAYLLSSADKVEKYMVGWSELEPIPSSTLSIEKSRFKCRPSDYVESDTGLHSINSTLKFQSRNSELFKENTRMPGSNLINIMPTEYNGIFDETYSWDYREYLVKNKTLQYAVKILTPCIHIYTYI